jgi:hypothetical protein
MSLDTLAVTLTVGQLRDLMVESASIALANLEQSKSSPNGKHTGTITEAAEHSGKPAEHLRELIDNGTLTNFGSKRRYLVSWSQLDQFFKKPQPGKSR